ncbi:MAG: hypothetical protein JWQ23_806 [Herminiimonas sp.]|nr:hypothetical protein [Herminiimonas sp.]
MKRFGMLSKSLVALALVAAAGASAAADPVRLKFASFVGPDNLLNTRIFNAFIENVNRDSQGTLEIKMFPGATLAKPTEVLQAVENGVADMGWGLVGYHPGRFKAATVAELPLDARDSRETSLAMWRLASRGMIDGFDRVKLLSLTTSEVSYIHLNNKGDIDSLKGRKIRTSGPISARVIQTLGGTPIQMPVSQTAEALSKGVLDGTIADWFAVRAFNFMESTKSHIDLPMGAGSAAYLIMRKETYDGLPAPAKAAIDKHSGEAFARFFGTTLYGMDRESRTMLATNPAHNIVQYKESDAKTKAVRQRLGVVVDQWAADTPKGAETLKAYKEELAKARKEVDKQ